MNAPVPLVLGGGFCAIDNVLDVQVELPIEITAGIQFARASQEQIATIKRTFEIMGLDMGHNLRSNRYELNWVDVGGRRRGVRLPPEQWRYFVLTFDMGIADHQRVHDVLKAVNLVAPALRSTYQFTTGDAHGRGRVQGNLWTGSEDRLAMLDTPPLEIVDDASVVRWRGAVEALTALNRQRYEGIHRAVDLFHRARHMPLHDDFAILGLFIVIEMLLTHQPGDKEIGDSLLHQLSTKIPLLSERMQEPIDYAEFGDDMPAPKRWKRLYGLRSAIAHGNHLDYNAHGLGQLNNGRAISQWLTAATRKLLRFALDEPSLYVHLKGV
jgi:hypothetical protein